MTDKLAEVIKAIEGCEGYLISYPTIKKMHQVKDELQAVIDEDASQQAPAPDAQIRCGCGGEWRTDGYHQNEFCSVCFNSRR